MSFSLSYTGREGVKWHHVPGRTSLSYSLRLGAAKFTKMALVSMKIVKLAAF